MVLNLIELGAMKIMVTSEPDREMFETGIQGAGPVSLWSNVLNIRRELATPMPLKPLEESRLTKPQMGHCHICQQSYIDKYSFEYLEPLRSCS